MIMDNTITTSNVCPHSYYAPHVISAMWRDMAVLQSMSVCGTFWGAVVSRLLSRQPVLTNIVLEQRIKHIDRQIVTYYLFYDI